MTTPIADDDAVCFYCGHVLGEIEICVDEACDGCGHTLTRRGEVCTGRQYKESVRMLDTQIEQWNRACLARLPAAPTTEGGKL